VHWFLLVFAVTGLAHLELWPFTGFRLFSELRPSVRESWAVVAVDPSGDEHTILLHDLPVAYRNTSRLLQGFDHRSPASRDRVCDAWAEPLREAGRKVARIRIYAVSASVRPDGPPPTRHLAYECGTPA
jgi:hypothetical protein